MSVHNKAIAVWRCDACGHAVEVEGDPGRPAGKDGWRQLVVGALDAKLGNLSAKHLCGDCAEALNLLLSGHLGDAGDMRQAVYDALSGVTTADGRGVSVENLRWAATHEALSRSFIFDVLMALADYLDPEGAK